MFSDVLQQAQMEIRKPRWSNHDDFVTALALEYHKGLEEWDAELFEVAIAAFLSTKLFLALQQTTNQYRIHLMDSYS